MSLVVAEFLPLGPQYNAVVNPASRTEAKKADLEKKFAEALRAINLTPDANAAIWQEIILTKLFIRANTQRYENSNIDALLTRVSTSATGLFERIKSFTK